jgi:predicted flavoprotein YhiN
MSTFLRKAVSLSPVAIGLLREAGPVPDDPAALAARLKACPLRVVGVAPIGRAISSAGGVEWSEIDEDFMLRARPGVFVAGEMIDWEAPTGGYLLQGAFATGAAAGKGATGWLARRVP